MLKVVFKTDDEVEIHKVTKIDFEHDQVFFKRGNIEYNLGTSVCDILYQSQFKDINNNYIYSGDIIKGERGTLAVKYIVGNCFVVYNPNCCEQCKKGDGCVESLEDFMFFHKDKIQILGNIYQNAELLEKNRGK